MSHPVEVALILAGMQMDMVSLQTGLLHDVVEDTGVTPRTDPKAVRDRSVAGASTASPSSAS